MVEHRFLAERSVSNAAVRALSLRAGPRRLTAGTTLTGIALVAERPGEAPAGWSSISEIRGSPAGRPRALGAFDEVAPEAWLLPAEQPRDRDLSPELQDTRPRV